ncbi:hypothetical protein TcasGA2_TC002604 [Tribolium castaneum]|uniref:Uncharacterized protein n=1 Tax=Tribolium castaneum TaxID=7070 RepID=D6WFG4_TRICA|nr:hypothetical protein TcasGA2_TC002604 [Tribolium castaneum]
MFIYVQFGPFLTSAPAIITFAKSRKFLVRGVIIARLILSFIADSSRFRVKSSTRRIEERANNGRYHKIRCLVFLKSQGKARLDAFAIKY